MKTGRTTLTFIDLFAGAGGFSLGFTRAGFRCVGAVEIDRCAAQSYATNFPQHAGLPLTRLGPVDGDIECLDQQTIRRALDETGRTEVDVVLAGPPCQAFSRVGRGKIDFLAKRNGAFKSDNRSTLYTKVLDMLAYVSPRAFLFENVAGILHFGGNNVAEIICEEAAALGYNVLCTILNSAWFGVPQIRERVFILGIRADLRVAPSFPSPIHRADLTRGHLTGLELSARLFRRSEFFRQTVNPHEGPPAVSAEEALGDLPAFREHLINADYRAVRSRIQPQAYRPGRPSAYATLMRCWDEVFTSGGVTDHYCRRTPRDYETFAQMKPGDKYPCAVEIAERRYAEARQQYTQGLRHSAPRRQDFVPPYPIESFQEKWRKLVPSEPSWTITAHLGKDCYSHIHYDSGQKRSITIREAARLQSFPDAFVFSGNMGDCFRQIGNAVPPLLSFALANHLGGLLSPKAPGESNSGHCHTAVRHSPIPRDNHRVHRSPIQFMKR